MPKVSKEDLFHRSLWIYSMTVMVGSFFASFISSFVYDDFTYLIGGLIGGMLFGMIGFLPLIIIVWPTLIYIYNTVVSRKQRNIYLIVFSIFLSLLIVYMMKQLLLHLTIFLNTYELYWTALGYCIAFVLFYLKVNIDYDKKEIMDWDINKSYLMDDILDSGLDK